MPLGMPIGTSGGGIINAYDIGAELCNMEFTQQGWIPFSPTWMEATRHVMAGPKDQGFGGAGEEGPYLDKDGKVLVSSEELHKMNPLGGYNSACINRIYQEMKKQ